MDSRIDIPDLGQTQHMPVILNAAAITREDKIASTRDASAVFLAGEGISTTGARTVEFSEKVDGSLLGILGFAGAKGDTVMVRNRSHILNKSFISRKTAAQAQYGSVWNWIYEHRDEFVALQQLSHVAVYGEWLHFAHGIFYNNLPSKFVAHTVWDMDYQQWVDPYVARKMLESCGFSMPQKLPDPKNVNELVALTQGQSGPPGDPWSDEPREGVYIKIGDGSKIVQKLKIVRAGFEPGKLFGSGLKNIIRPRKGYNY